VSITSVMLSCSYSKKRPSASFPKLVVIVHQQPLFACLLVECMGLWQMVLNICLLFAAHVFLPVVKSRYIFP
jgi:hypothetical protein